MFPKIKKWASPFIRKVRVLEMELVFGHMDRKTDGQTEVEVDTRFMFAN